MDNPLIPSYIGYTIVTGYNFNVGVARIEDQYYLYVAQAGWVSNHYCPVKNQQGCISTSGSKLLWCFCLKGLALSGEQVEGLRKAAGLELRQPQGALAEGQWGLGRDAHVDMGPEGGHSLRQAHHSQIAWFWRYWPSSRPAPIMVCFP